MHVREEEDKGGEGGLRMNLRGGRKEKEYAVIGQTRPSALRGHFTLYFFFKVIKMMSVFIVLFITIIITIISSIIY